METEGLNVAEPRFCGVRIMSEYVPCNSVKNIVRQLQYHGEQGQLSDVEKTRQRKGTSQEEDNTVCCVFVKPEKSF